ncbi:MAG: PEP-CTERM sorting domain-containing protein [Roseiarcus sp.]|uniref:PEP-CTERM sorting domain-containing protein n=1 Tax=Roseiarcus sp. TaxID=1969460 RepID=UPI003C35187C
MSILGFVTKTCARRFAAPVAAALLATTCAASAATFTYADGTITGLQLTFDTPITGTGYAGQIHLSNVDGSGQTVDVWCVDLPTDFLTGGGTYGVHPSSYLLTRPNGIPALSLSQIGELGALAVHGDLLVASPGSYTSDEVAAAIQLAMWDIEYGSAFTYVALGSPVDTAPPGTSGLVGEYLANVGFGNLWGLDYNFAAFSEVGNQVLIWAPEPTVTVLTGTPEPSTWAMMVIGFAGLGFAGYRRAKAKAAFANA